MEHRVLRRQLLTTLVVCLLGASSIFAQAPVDRRATTLEVRGLTAAMRDGLAQDLRRNGQYKIAFACVPAGIIIIEPTAARQDRQTGTDLLELVNQRIERNSITRSTVDRNAAEARCAEVRNR